ncbi:MAG: hypothetical protein MN733_15415, partial [Nitrososphaera sp.]|nr:hypothetical protein [Nitrososphaera sp.]
MPISGCQLYGLVIQEFLGEQSGSVPSSRLHEITKKGESNAGWRINEKTSRNYTLMAFTDFLSNP